MQKIINHLYWFHSMVKEYDSELPSITAPANKGEDMQVPLRPLSPDYTVFIRTLLYEQILHCNQGTLTRAAQEANLTPQP